MKWFGQGSGNVEDRRGMGGIGGGVALGGLGTIIVVIISLLTGQNPMNLINQVQNQGGGGSVQTEAPAPPASDSAAQFVSIVLSYTEQVWDDQFARMQREYEKPKLVIFRSQIQSACGGASAAVGPFYCPGDHKVYIDLSFYDDLKNRFGASGDFAMAYVIAHEVGHHVQTLLGTSAKVEEARRQLPEVEYNKMSVKLELQADFYAGLWANHAQSKLGILEPGDIDEALTAANAIGDDKIQQQTQGQVVPDAFTHGTSAQRVAWFKRGFETGDISAGNTFEDRGI